MDKLMLAMSANINFTAEYNCIISLKSISPLPDENVFKSLRKQKNLFRYIAIKRRYCQVRSRVISKTCLFNPVAWKSLDTGLLPRENKEEALLERMLGKNHGSSL